MHQFIGIHTHAVLMQHCRRHVIPVKTADITITQSTLPMHIDSHIDAALHESCHLPLQAPRTLDLPPRGETPLSRSRLQPVSPRSQVVNGGHRSAASTPSATVPSPSHTQDNWQDVVAAVSGALVVGCVPPSAQCVTVWCVPPSA